MSDHITPWQPITDPLTLAVLGKLGEELNEAAGRVSRSVIQGLDATDPDSGLLNSVHLSWELGHVLACIDMLGTVLAIVPDQAQRYTKIVGYQRWHNMIIAQAMVRAMSGAELATGLGDGDV